MVLPHALYSTIPGSPTCKLTRSYFSGVSDTINLEDGSIAPDAPNIITVMTGDKSHFATVKYGAKTDGALTDLEVIYGAGYLFEANSAVAVRNYTHEDDVGIKQNIIHTEQRVSALEGDVDAVSDELSAHISNKTNPHDVTKSQIGLGNVDNTSDEDKPISSAAQEALTGKVDKVTGASLVPDAKITAYDAHLQSTGNPHSVTKNQVGLGNVDNTADLDKPISTAAQTALDDKASVADFNAHTTNKSNPHEVTKAQVGLGNAEDGAQINIIESISKNGTEQTIVNKNVNLVLSKSDVGLGNVDNTSDSVKATATGNPIHDAIETKEPAFTKNTAFNKNFGTASGTVCQGNDARLSDARPPTAHATTHKTGGSDAITPADIGAEPAITKKTAFNKDFGNASGTVCEGNDSRLNNARTPTAHAATHGNSGTDKITIAESQVTNLTTDLAAKVNINQGTANAGKYMTVGSDGNITPTEFGRVYGIRIPYGSTSANIEYTDYAAGMNETQRRALVQSWAKHAVVQNGRVKYWLDESDLSKKADGTASVLDGTDGDVMLMYKPIFWKVAHVDNSYTLIQFSDYDFDVGNTVTAHRYGDGICAYLGLGVFEGTIVDNVLRSINTETNPAVSKTNDAFYAAAVQGRTYGHYNQMLPLTWTLYAILLLFEGGNRDTQAKWGRGLVSLSTASPVNKDWSETSAWYHASPYQDGTHGVTAGGIQNMWGNVWKFLGEFLKETDNVAYFTVRGGSDHQLISTAGNPDTWASVQMLGAQAYDGYVMDVIGDNNLPFLPRTKGAGSGTYWADYCYSSNARNCGIVGGRWDAALTAGLFYVYVSNAVGYSSSSIGARLQVLIE